MDRLVIKKHAKDPTIFEGWDISDKNTSYPEMIAFQIHEDLLRDLISEEAFERLDDGEEIEFRLVEVK